MTTITARVFPPAIGSRRAARMIERNAMVYRRTWLILVSGVFEPLFYLLSIGVGIGKLLTQDLHAPNGDLVTYTAFVAPALLASSAMNGAVFDATFNMFFKLKYAKTYDAILATPVSVRDVALGEIAWALLRGALYAVAFLCVMAAMGLVHSWWALAALPTATLIGFTFAALGMAGTSYMRGWQDFQYVTLGVLPLFLFSATFYPLDRYPGWMQLVVEATPLYHGVALMRSLILGGVGISDLGHAAYLLVLGLVCAVVTGRRLERLLLR
ncbi:MAG: lipooligosaccharide transport system permease protein [Frankiales bacterium]|jgi:lipooligosaccharide transport system permease protein|nr:lipooligosaccharide transport system permease protein [Frankiales bacterium]